MLINNLKKVKLSWPAIFGIIVSIYTIFFCFPDHTQVYVHDTMDDYLAIMKFIANHKNYFSLDPTVLIKEVMNGMPRGTFFSFCFIPSLLYKFMPAFFAYTINFIIVTLIAYIGMYLLIFRHLVVGKYSNLISSGTALCFSILPTYTIYGLSVVGIPMLANSFLNIYKLKYSKWDYLVIILFPFYSYLAFSGLFISLTLIGIFLKTILFNKKWHWPFFIGLSLLGVLQLCVEYQLIYTMLLNDNFISFRNTWTLKSAHFINAIKRGVSYLLYGQYHAVSLHNKIITIILPLSLLLTYFGKNTTGRDKLLKLLLSILAIISFTIFWSSYFSLPIRKLSQIFITFQWDRFYVFLPTIMYSLFAIALIIIANNLKSIANSISLIPHTFLEEKNMDWILKSIIIIIIFFQCLYILKANIPFKNTILSMQNKYNPKLNFNKTMTIKEFYSEELFQNIKNYINLPPENYRIVSVGYHPNITLFNGFYQLDAYLKYSLNYKKKFQILINNELNKNEKMKKYFVDWGQRAYIFSSELWNYNQKTNTSYGYNKQNFILKDLEINLVQLKLMGGKYIFSRYKIESELSKKLILHKEFNHSESPWKIYLYEVK